MSDQQTVVKAPVDGEWLVPAPWAKWAPRQRANVVIGLRKLQRNLEGYLNDRGALLTGMLGVREEVEAALLAFRQLELAICPEGEIDE